MEEWSAADANTELVDVFSRAVAQVEAASDALSVPAHVRCAQAMLQMAVEWRLPGVERWAVAWLMAAGGTQLRLRWSSRARDGRFRREAEASDRIMAIAGNDGCVMLALGTGAVERWADDGVVRPVLPAVSRPAYAVAACGDWLVVAGPNLSFQTLGWASGPPPVPEPDEGLMAAAISADGHVALGTESGNLRTWAPDRPWRRSETDIQKPVRAVAFAAYGAGPVVSAASGSASDPARLPEPELIRVAWESGEVGELAFSDDHQAVRLLHSFGNSIKAAAWTRDGTLLAAAIGPDVWLLSAEAGGRPAARRLWTQEPEVLAMAWSPDNILVSASKDQIYASTTPVTPSGAVLYKSIRSDEEIQAIGLAGSGHVVTTQGRLLVQWELSKAGSDDQTFSSEDHITAVGIQPGDRRVTLAGTDQGRLREYSGAGVLAGEAELPAEARIGQLVPLGEVGTWAVASVDGIYEYRPGTPPQPIQPGFFQYVAAGAGRLACAENNKITTSDGREFFLPAAVTGLLADRDGTVTAIDAEGHVLRQRPGEDAVRGPRKERATRLLDSMGEALLIREPDGWIRSTSPQGDLSFGQHPADLLTAAYLGPRRIVLAYRDKGILLAHAGPQRASFVAARVSEMAVNAGRIVVATPNNLAGFDVLEAEHARGEGSVPLHVRSDPDGFLVTFPDGAQVLLAGPPAVRMERVLNRGPDQAVRVTDLSDAVFQAGQIGDLLWQGGLDLAIDHARGPDPDRPVRLDWHCPADDDRADLFAWELLHPSTEPLGWFGNPAITSVRRVSTARPAGRPAGRAAGASPTMLVVRGIARGLKDVDDAFERFRRRSRRTDVDLIHAKPKPVGTSGDLIDALCTPADILQLWMHSGDEGVALTDSRRVDMSPGDLADLLSGRPPRLTILVGCSSGALGRALIRCGVLAAVAMRVPVFDHTVQPLVEDVTATVLAGAPVDLAYAQALRRYLLTGQPGAAAVPMLFLAAGADTVLFPQH